MVRSAFLLSPFCILDFRVFAFLFLLFFVLLCFVETAVGIQNNYDLSMLRFASGAAASDWAGWWVAETSQMPSQMPDVPVFWTDVPLFGESDEVKL